jgi:hypothetical protein
VTADSEVREGYNRVIKSRLQKKLEVSVNLELPVPQLQLQEGLKSTTSKAIAYSNNFHSPLPQVCI